MSISRINFIGCGRLGQTLGALFKKNNAAIIGGIVNSSYKSAMAAATFIGQGTPYQKIQELPPADIYIIATPDDAVQSTCNELISGTKAAHGKTIIHCSGSLTSDILNRAKQYNCHTASIHPIKSFANPEESIKTFAGTYCAIEGDDTILNHLADLFKKLGANVFKINKGQKKIYHAASVLANNYLVALHYHALQCYKTAGIDDNTANSIVSMLMTETLKNLQKLDHMKALTGPLQRGDTKTVENHIQALAEYPLTKNIYTSLGQAALPLTQHSPSKIAELKDALASDSAKPKLAESGSSLKLFSKL